MLLRTLAVATVTASLTLSPLSATPSREALLVSLSQTQSAPEYPSQVRTSWTLTNDFKPTCSNRAPQVKSNVAAYVSWSYNRDYTRIGNGLYTWTFWGTYYRYVLTNGYSGKYVSSGSQTFRCYS